MCRNFVHILSLYFAHIIISLQKNCFLLYSYILDAVAALMNSAHPLALFMVQIRSSVLCSAQQWISTGLGNLVSVSVLLSEQRQGATSGSTNLLLQV